MNEIKFSHNYPKLWNQKTGLLLRVTIRDRERDMSKSLIEYDTKYAEGKYYELKKGKYLHLVFLGNEGIPFSTIRRWTPDKEKYYLGLVGQELKIILMECGD